MTGFQMEHSLLFCATHVSGSEIEWAGMCCGWQHILVLVRKIAFLAHAAAARAGVGCNKCMICLAFTAGEIGVGASA